MKRKLLYLLITGLCLVSGITVRAANYAPVSGTATQFKQYLILDKEARLPDVTFAYEVTAGTASAYTDETMTILAGVMADRITVSDAVFSQSDTINSDVASADTVTISSEQGYGVKTVSIDFSDVSFDEPGIYRYVLTMTSAGQQGIRYDTQAAVTGAKVRCLDVYVTDDEGVLKVSNYVLHETASDISRSPEAGSAFSEQDSERLSDKSDGFVNELVTADLKFGNETEGNQGSRDKYFKYTLNLENALKNTVYYLDMSEAETNGTGNSATIYDELVNPVQITTDAEGKATADFYLKDGQYIRVKGLTENTAYALTEANEDYLKREGTDRTAIEAVGEQPAKLHDDPVSGTIQNQDVYTGYTNVRNGVIPTGIIMSSMPGIVMITSAIGGICLLFGKKEKEEEQE